MQNLIDILGLRQDLEGAGANPDDLDFEAFYDDLVTSGANPKLQKNIEDRVWDYFSSLSLPHRPTIYDYLMLSLRDKDLIATFNWDPFLLQAYRRNGSIKKLPRIAFLHGNVGVAICEQDKVVGLSGTRCFKCGRDLKPSKLLYPVKHKDYNSNPFIKSQWEVLRNYLGHAYYLTIFGYRAPKTDVEARALMLEVWRENPTLQLAEVDIIDIGPREELENNWDEFFVSHHYGIFDNFFNSYLIRHPRRSCDAFAEATLMLRPWHENPFPQFQTLAELQKWIAPLLSEEEAYEERKEPFSCNPLPPNEPL
jgi:hypothetical protein